MLNRDREMRLLHEKFENVKKYGGKVILLHGRSGVGKTTLIREFMSKVPSKYFSIDYGSNPLEPFISYIGEKIFEEDLMKFLRSRLPPEVIREGLEKIILSTRLSAYQTIKEKLFDTEPLLVVIDDAENMGKETAHLILYLARAISSMKVMLVIIIRSDFLNFSEIKEIIPILRREGLLEEIELAPLEDKYLIEIIKMEAKECVSMEYVRNLLEIASGDINIIKHVMKGELYKEYEGVIFSTLEDRFNNMEDTFKKILIILSLLNMPIDIDDLSNMIGEDLEKTAEYVDILLEDGWIVEDENRVRISSGRIASILIEISEREKIKSYHNLIGKYLESKGKYCTAAIHYKCAEEYRKAFSLFIKAAELAIERFSLSESIECLRNALRLAKSNPDIDRELVKKALSLYGHVAILTSKPTILEEFLEKFEDIPEHNSILMWYYYLTGNFALAEEYGKKCLKDVNEETLAAVYRILSLIDLHRGNFVQSEEYLRNSLELATKVNNKQLKILVLNDLGILEELKGNPTAAVEYFKKAVEVDPEDRFSLLPIFNMGEVFIDLGKLSIAEELVTKAIKQTIEKNYIAEQHYFLVSLGRIKMERMEFLEADEIFSKVYRFFHELKIPYLEAQILVEWGRLHLRIKNREIAKEKFKESYRIATELESEFLQELAESYINLLENRADLKSIKFNYIRDMINKDVKYLEVESENGCRSS